MFTFRLHDQIITLQLLKCAEKLSNVWVFVNSSSQNNFKTGRAGFLRHKSQFSSLLLVLLSAF